LLTQHSEREFLTWFFVSLTLCILATVTLVILIGMDGEAKAAAATVPGSADKDGDSPMVDASSAAGNSPADLEKENNVSLNLGNIYRQCSLSRIAANTMSVTEIKSGNCVTSAVSTPPIGSLDWPGDPDVLKTFHGGRNSKGGRTTNECISSSFDPRNLYCLGCEKPHHVLNKNKPPVLVFADQNFTPFLSGGEENCIAVCRSENASLSELVDLATEILDRLKLPPGTTILFGSGSHLFKVGAPQYATDWIMLVNRCTQKWPGANICPLIPLCRTDCPGSLARDICTLAAWLGRVYQNSTTGLLDTWKLLLKLTDAICEGIGPVQIAKVTLPTSISVGSISSHTFAYNSSCPEILPGLTRKATEELLRSLIETVNRDFSANINPNIVLTNNWAGKEDCIDPGENTTGSKTDMSRHMVLIGASNLKRLVPFLHASGITVTDLTVPSWLATPENIEFLLSKLDTLSLDPGYTIVLELFGNSTFRFMQFDGTMAMPFKMGRGHHMGGKIGTCDEDSFLRLVSNLDELIKYEGPGIKIFIPPLPRYLFKGCCEDRNHSTNVKDEGYGLKLLQETARFRGTLKKALLRGGLDDFFVLDGIGALIGTTPGGNRGTAAEILPELENYMAADNVHYTDPAYKNLSAAIVAAAEGVRNGTLTKTGLR
jgi:hypothetical protein